MGQLSEYLSETEESVLSWHRLSCTDHIVSVPQVFMCIKCGRN